MFKSTQIHIVGESQKNLAKKYKFNSWADAYWVFAGKMSCCAEFDETPNPKICKELKGRGYFPKLNSKEGKSIHQEIKNIPVIETNELNDCIGFEGDIFYQIGVALFNNVKYFGFVIKKEWDIATPADCKEVTETEYYYMFRNKNDIEINCENVL